MFSNTKLFIILLSLTGCASSQKLQQTPPVEFGEVYAQRWSAGVKEGGYGYDIYIPIKEDAIKLDSVYFRDNAAKLTYNKNTKTYIGRFKTDIRVADDITLSKDLEEESKNQFKTTSNNPFKLNPNQCVVSYIKGGNTQYFKIDNIKEKQSINYPSAPPRQ